MRVSYLAPALTVSATNPHASGPNSLGSNIRVCTRIHIQAHSHISAAYPDATGGAVWAEPGVTMIMVDPPVAGAAAP